MSFAQIVETAGLVVEGLGVAVLLLGSITFLGVLLYRLSRGQDARIAYRTGREGLGRVILLGLEILVAGDIIATVAIQPSLTSVAVLAGIVAIRTFLSWSIEMETEGRWPWQSRRDV